MIFILYVPAERRALMDMRPEIEKKAYELYEKNGRADGFELQHWLEAEKIVRARLGGVVSGGTNPAGKSPGTKPVSKTTAAKTMSKAAVTKRTGKSAGKKAPGRK